MLQPGIRSTVARLPVTDDSGFFSIRLESIGGYGAHIAGRILAEAGVLGQGLKGSNFSSYGSEKKGSPVTAYVRFCSPDHEVRTSAPIEEPHVVGVFHEALGRTQPVVAGLQPNGVALLNSRVSPAEGARLLKMQYGTIGVVDAIGIALAEGSRVNMVMLGALCRAISFMDPESVKHVIRDTFAKKYPATIPGNLRAFDRGYQEVVYLKLAGEAPADRPVHRPRPVYGYMNAPIGGVIVNPGNSIYKDLSASRQGFLPEFLRDKCIDCTRCDMVCPDICFVWEEGQDKRGRSAIALKGIDYQYCKGCLKCVEACPTDALLTIREEGSWADEHRVPHPFAP